MLHSIPQLLKFDIVSLVTCSSRCGVSGLQFIRSAWPDIEMASRLLILDPELL